MYSRKEIVRDVYMQLLEHVRTGSRMAEKWMEMIGQERRVNAKFRILGPSPTYRDMYVV